MPVVPSRFAIIAGGSGSGKTTLALGLLTRFPDWTIVHLDDYQKPREQIPKLGRHRNWDHPEAVDFERLIRDLQALRRGESVMVMARDQTAQTDDYAPKTVVPGPRLILEGYLALWHQKVREMADLRVYLDAPPDVRLARRRWKKSEAYVKDVLEPMHVLHVEPTKAHADLVIDVGSRTSKEILEWVVTCLDPTA